MKYTLLRFVKWLYSVSTSKFNWFVFGAALTIRLFIVLIAGNISHPLTYEHGKIAHNLLTGHGYAMHWPYAPLDSVRAALMDRPPVFESSYQPPVNPYLMYGIFCVLGETTVAYLTLMLIYSVCNSMLSVLSYLTIKEFASEHIARTGALIATLFLPAAVSVTTFSGSPLYMVVVAVLLLYAVRIAYRANWKHFIAFGIVGGVSILMRSELFALAFILLAIASLLAARTNRSILIIPSTIVSALLMIAIVAPWTYRNYELFRKFIPVVDRPWHEIWRGNNAFSTPSGFDGPRTGVFLSPRLFPGLVRTADSIPYDQYFVIRLDSVFRHEALTYAEVHPAKTVAMGVRKVLMLLTFSYAPDRSNNAFSFLYPISMLALTIPTIIGLIAMLRAGRRSSGWNAAILYSTFLLFYCGISFITFVIPRYQIYVFVLLIPIAAVGYDRIAQFLRQRGIIKMRLSAA
jgi:4-amino-4-deoxy-L-arabinose transferase-like glycosyltransferase